MTRFYRLRHKPTGLFFKPSSYGNKQNLSKDGKIYINRMPTLKWLESTYRHPDGDWNWVDMPVREEDWEVVEYKLVEQAVYYYKKVME